MSQTIFSTKIYFEGGGQVCRDMQEGGLATTHRLPGTGYIPVVYKPSVLLKFIRKYNVRVL